MDFRNQWKKIQIKFKTTYINHLPGIDSLI